MSNYDWIRFWCLREGAMMSGRGYLYVLGDYQKDVVTFDKISHIPCLALLGEPGIGKSYALETEIKNLERTLTKQSNEGILFFNLRSYSSEVRLIEEVFENEKFREWLSGSDILNLFLDSV